MAAIIEEQNMSKATPLQNVKKLYGSKQALVEKVAGLLPADEGESKEDFLARLRTVANAKLLRLVAIGEKVAELGGKTGLVDKIAELKNQPKDGDFKAKLAKLSVPRLLDTYQSLNRRAGKNKK